ncbi:hypothetical protein WQ53_07755 [Pseudoxanthomonas suwonensis]|uniref:OmpA-like domain-containing protein n=2 Tax=Pseudoxanthomonas suwonensis TaxID=314722 RepID=A0A0E3UMW9_9GAMM|nr:hypothetical protein WQ53_07755 [Pseudoxanthomonas suwonensis]
MGMALLACGAVPAHAQTQVQNGAQVSLPAGVADDPSDNSDSVTVGVYAVALGKTASPASGTPVAVGDTIQYTITATISAGTTAAPILITDTPGPGLQPVTPLPAGCTQAGGNVECVVPAGTTGTYSVTYGATVLPSAGLAVANSATGGDSCPAACTTTHPVYRGVTLTKAWENGRPGDSVQLTISGPGVQNAVPGSSAVSGTTTPATAVAQPGSTVTVAEVFSPAASAGNYTVALTCVRDIDGVIGATIGATFIMPADSSLTCTATNTRRSAQLQLVKTWVNAQPGDTATVTSNGFTFPATVSSTADATGGNSTTGAQVVVYAGESGTITETLSSPANYTAAMACTGNAIPLSGNTLTVAGGDTAITCTQTNTRRPVNLVLEKRWVNALVGEQAQVSASGSLHGPVTLDSSADTATETDTGTAQQVYAGETLTLSETFATAANAANYTSVLSCSGNGTPLAGDQLTVGAADTTITCRYTNTRLQATLQLNKVWGPNSRGGDQAQLAATTGLLNNTNAFTSTASVGAASITATVYAGEIATLPAETMSAGALANYTVAVSCSGGALSGTDGKVANTLEVLPADQGQPIQCTYANTRNSTTLQLQKTWLNGLPGDTVSLVASGKGTFNSSASGGPSQTDSGPVWTAYAGEVITIDESFGTITSNLYLETLACTNTSGLVNDPGDPTRGTLTVGATDGPIVCTFTNDRKSTELYVRKVWGGPVTGATVSIPATTGFINNSTPFTSTDPTATTVGPFEVFAFETGQLPAESFTTGNAADFDSNVSCDGTDTNLGNGLTISIADADAGVPVTCTYSNTFVPRPSLVVDKSTTVTSVNAAGDVIPYSITITNDGNVPLDNVTLDDPLLVGQGTLSCNPSLPATLVPGATVSCTGSYTVTQADIDRFGSGDGSDDDFVTNTADASGTDPDGATITDTDDAETALPARDFVADFSKSGTLADTNGSGQGSAGETITYNFTITNNGNATIQSVTIVDPLLPGLSCGPIGPLAPGQSVLVGSPAPPADVLCTGNTYVITQADIDSYGGGSGNIDNIAFGTGTSPTGGSASGEASETTPLDPPAPRLHLDKTASPASVSAAGEVVTYSFTVTNAGNVTVAGIEVVDPKAGLGPITCTPAAPFDLAPGASATCSATYTVTQADIDAGGVMVNTATAAGTYDGRPVVDTDTAAVDIDTGPGTATIIKTADKTFVSSVGEQITYTFTASNNSQVTLTDAQIVQDTVIDALACDVIPTLAPGQTATFSCNGTHVYTVQQQDIDNQGNPVADSGVILNTVTGQATYLDDGNPVTATDSDDWIVDLPARAPGLFLRKSSNVVSVPGPNSPVLYSFDVTNTGNTTLLNLTITDSLLPGLDCDPIASLPPAGTVTFTCDAASSTYTVTQADIDSGSTDFKPNDGQIDNRATVSATVAGTTDILTNSDVNEVTLPVRQPAITLLKQADVTSIAAPLTVNYSFRVTNTGNVTVNDVTVSDGTLGLACPASPAVNLPPGASVLFGGSGQPGVDVVCTGTARAVTQADIDTETSIENAAAATGVTVSGPSGPVNLQATSTLSIPIVKNPSLAFGKAADVASVALPGDPIVYTITGTNNGNITLTNVRVVDPRVPSLSCTPPTPITSLAPGEDFTCIGTYLSTPLDFDTNGGGDGDIDNTAEALWNGGRATASATVQLPIPVQTLALVKTAGSPSIDQGLDAAVTDAGDTITYTFVVTNTGNQTLTQLVINDANLNGPVTCDRTVLEAAGPNETATCTGVHTITQAEMDNGVIDNTATASATPPASARVTSAPDTATVPLAAGPQIQLDKSAAAPTTAQGALPSVTDAGDTIQYGFVVTNTGNVTLSTITLNDPSLNPAAVSCPPGQLAPGASMTCASRTYTITQANMDAGSVSNTATASGNPPSGAAVTDDDATTTALAESPALALVKTATPTTVSAVGQQVGYAFQVTNTGNVTIGQIAIREDDFTGSGAVSAISCSPTSIAPGAVANCNATYSVTQQDLDQGSIVNDATATGQSPTAVPVESNQDQAQVTVLENAALTLVKAATPDVVSVADTPIAYTYTVTNTGNVTLDTIAVTETAFDGNNTPAPVPDCSGQPAALAPGASYACTAAYVFNQDDLDAGFVNNTAQATALDPGDNVVGPVTSSKRVTGDQFAELVLDKSVSPSQVSQAGVVVTYTFQVTNTGNITIDGVQINETAFDGTSALTPPTCADLTLAPGQATTCTTTYTVQQADVDQGGIHNEATVSGTDPGGASVVSAPDAADVDVDAQVQLDLAKSVLPLAVSQAGQQVVYIFQVSNIGNTTINDLVVTELAFSGTGSPPVADCARTTLAPGERVQCTATYTATQADIDAGVVTNTAEADGTTTNAGPAASAPSSAQFTAAAAPALALTKTASPTTVTAVGDTVSYSFLVANTGNVTIDNLSVTETAFSGTGTAPTITCPVSELAPGADTTCTSTAYAVTQADLDAGQVTNTATANGQAPDGTAVPSPPSSATVTVDQDVQLQLVKSVLPTQVSTAGQVLAYSFEVTNTGNVTVNAIAIEEAGFSGSGTMTGVVCGPAAGTLAPGDSVTCTATYQVTQVDMDAGSIDNVARANAVGPGGPVASNDDDAQVTVDNLRSASLAKEVTPTTVAAAGEQVTYEFLITNTGNQTVTDPVVEERAFSGTGGWPVVTCPAGSYPPNASVTCTASYTVTQADIDAGQVTNTARAQVTPPDGIPLLTNEDDAVVTATAVPGLSLEKAATPTSVSAVGDTIDYTFLVTNTGGVTVNALVVTETAFSGSGTVPAPTCAVTTLAPAASTTCTASYVVTQADLLSGRITNTAVASGTVAGGSVDSGPDDAEVTVVPAVTTVAKAVDPASGTEVAPGDVLTYTVTATVADASLHEPVTLTDTLGPGLTFGAVTSAGAFGCNAANPLVCTLPAGTPPGSYPLVYTATVAADATGSVGNNVVASKDPGVDPPVTCTVCDTDNPVVASTSTVSKASTPASATPVNPGTLITYTVTTVVSGSVTTEDITLVDTLDPGLTFGAVTNPGAYSCSGALTCVLPAGTLPGSYDFTYTATVDADATGAPRNVVVPSNPAGGDAEPTCTVCDTIHPVSRPSIALEKKLTANDDADGNGEVSVGDTLTYGVTATNTGNVPLANVTIDDPITTPDSLTCPLVTPGGTCELVATYTVTQADADAGQVLNTATVQTEAPPDVPPLPPQACPAGSADPACATEIVTPVIQRPAIATTKTAVLTVDNATPGKGNIGDVVTYTVNATNTGNVTLTGVTVTDTFQGGAPVTLACAPTTLVPGQVASCDSYEHVITEEEVHSDIGLLVNTVLAQGDAGLVSGTIQVTANAAAQVEVQNEPAQLYLTKVAGVRQVNVGDLVRYTLTLENTGEIDLVDGYIIDTPPAGFTYVEGSLQGRDDDGLVTATGISPLRISDIDLAAGNTATISYLMRVGAGVRPGTQVNRAVAYDPAYEGPASNVATAEVVLGSDPMLDESLISGTVFNDRDGDAWQDSAALTGVRVQGGFAPGAYIAGSTTIDRGAGAQSVPDASAPLLRGLELGRIEGRQSPADPAAAHEVVIRQRLREPDFTGDFVLTSAQGATVRMAADGSTTLETRGDAAKGLTAAAPTVRRQVAQSADGYQVDYVVRNEGIDERGIPGVRIASVEGLLIETDQYGRYHLVGIDAGRAARGRNFVLKVDTATLPPGSELTTENPKVRRITGGVPTRFDFGVRLPEQVIEGRRDVEMTLGTVVFAPGSAQVQARYLAVVDSMAEQVRRHGGGEVVIDASGETGALALARAAAVQALLGERLDESLRPQVAISVRADPDDPASLLAGIGEGGTVLGTFLFDTDKATIPPRFDPLLDELARQVAASGGEAISIIGHADRRGSREYNAALGLRRAKAVYEALAQRLPPEVRARLTVEVESDPGAPLGPPAAEGTP